MARDPVSITFGRLMIIPSMEVIVRVFQYLQSIFTVFTKVGALRMAADVTS